ncbi:MAG TPA: hypothetical protein VIK09_00210 [Candidatus Humimicrobiaceae bacterium]
MTLVLKNGIKKVTSIIRKHTDLPIIYDHQKFGSDIPEICSGEILRIIKDAGTEALVVFPHAIPEKFSLFTANKHPVSINDP